MQTISITTKLIVFTWILLSSLTVALGQDITYENEEQKAKERRAIEKKMEKVPLDMESRNEIDDILNDDGSKKLNIPLELKASIVSRYIWRGHLLAGAPCIQPSLAYKAEKELFKFEIGAWASQAFIPNEGTQADTYLKFSYEPFSIAFYNRFFPNDSTKVTQGATNDYLNLFNSGYFKTAHIYELQIRYDGVKGFPLQGMAAYNFHGADNEKSVYVELSYPLTRNLLLYTGAGNGVYSYESNSSYSNRFAIVNMGLNYTHHIPITNKFSLPIFGTFAFNPNLEKPLIAFGIRIE